MAVYNDVSYALLKVDCYTLLITVLEELSIPLRHSNLAPCTSLGNVNFVVVVMAAISLAFLTWAGSEMGVLFSCHISLYMCCSRRFALVIRMLARAGLRAGPRVGVVLCSASGGCCSHMPTEMWQ